MRGPKERERLDEEESNKPMGDDTRSSSSTFPLLSTPTSKTFLLKTTTAASSARPRASPWASSPAVRSAPSPKAGASLPQPQQPRLRLLLLLLLPELLLLVP